MKPTLLLSLVALAASATAVDPDKLTESSAGTYIAPVRLETQAVRLVLDSREGGFWVRCSVFESSSCETESASNIVGGRKVVIDRQAQGNIRPVDKGVIVTTKRFATVEVGGVTLTDIDVNIVYDPLTYLPPGCDGLLGINRVIGFDYTPTWPTRDTTISLDLEGETFAVSESASDFVKRSRMPTAVEVQFDVPFRTTVSCVRPVTKKGLEPCLPIDTSILPDLDTVYMLDPASANLVLPTDSLGYFAEKYLQGCTPVKSRTQILHYECPESVGDLTAILPSLAFEINSWRFILEARDYVNTLQSDANRVLLGDYEPGVAAIQLGAPFLRKFPVYVNETFGGGVFLMLCDSCEEVDANATNVKPIYENDATDSADQGKASQPGDAPTQTPSSNGGRTPLHSSWAVIVAVALVAIVQAIF